MLSKCWNERMDVGGRCKQVKSLRRADELSGGKKIALNEICNSKNKKEKNIWKESEFYKSLTAGSELFSLN